jgi:hypothetical protein
MPNICNLTQGWDDRVCALSIGGVRRALFVPIANIDYTTKTIANEVLTVLNPVTAGQGGYMYELEPELSTANYPINRSERGSVLHDISFNMVLNNDTKELRAELFRLARNRCVVFVEKTKGEWLALGLMDGLRLTDGNEGGTGTVKTDPNGHSLTFIGQEAESIPNVLLSVITALTIVDSPASSPSSSSSSI